MTVDTDTDTDTDPDAGAGQRPGRATGSVSWLRHVLATLGLWARLVRSEPMLVIAVATIALLGAGLLATGARMLHRVSTDDLQRSIADGQPIDRTVSQELSTRIGPGPSDDPFRQVDERGQRFLDERVPPEVAEVLGPRQFVVDSPPYRVGSFPDQDDGPFTLSFRFRYQQDIDQQLTLVDGALPTEREPVPVLLGPDCPVDRLAVDGFEPAEDQQCRAVDVPVHQVAVTAQTAEDLLLGVGQRAILRPDIIDPAWAFAFDRLLQERLVLEISGIIELSDPADAYWFGDSSLHRPRVNENADVRIVLGTGVLDPASYRRLIRNVLDVEYDYTWRHPVMAERVDTVGAVDLLNEFERLETRDGRVVTRVPQVIREHLEQRDLTVALLSVAAAGVAAVAAAAVWVLTALTAARQDHAWRLLLERGVGRPMVVAAAVAHGLAVAVPSAAVGLLAGIVLVPATPMNGAVAAVVILAAAVIVATAAATVAAVVNRTATAGRLVAGAERRRSAMMRRAVRDGLLLILATGAALLLGRRDGSGGLDRSGDLDLLLAVTPTLIGAGFAVATLRLGRPLLGLLARLATRLSLTAPYLGLRRLTADDRAARSSMVVVVLAVGLAGLAWSVRTSVDSARLEEGWQAIGADVEIRGQADGAPLAAGLVAARDELGQASALQVRFPAAAISAGPPTDGGEPGSGAAPERPLIDVVAIETGPTGVILASAPPDVGRSVDLDRLTSTPAAAGAGADGSIGAILVGPWPGEDPVAPGDRLATVLNGTEVEIRLIANVDRFPGLPSNRPSIVVDLEQLAAVKPGPLPATAMHLLGPTGTGDELRSFVEREGPGSRLRSRTELVSATGADPLAGWALRGLAAMAGYAIALAVVAALAGLGLTAPTRHRDLGLLSTLGLRRRQAAAVTTIEQLLPVALAGSAGIGLALVLVVVLRPAIDLVPFAAPAAEFVGLDRGPTPDGAIELTPDRSALAASFGVVLGALTAAVVVVNRHDRRAERRTIVGRGGEP